MSDPDQHRSAHSLLGLSLPCKTMGANAQVATRCYLMLQTQGRLCDGHCLIVPSQLVVSLVQVCIHSYPHNPGSQAARTRSCRTFLAHATACHSSRDASPDQQACMRHRRRQEPRWLQGTDGVNTFSAMRIPWRRSATSKSAWYELHVRRCAQPRMCMRARVLGGRKHSHSADKQRCMREQLQTFHQMDQDCVFFESAMGLDRMPHAYLECVPMPRAKAANAPMYFKKAINESENGKLD